MNDLTRASGNGRNTDLATLADILQRQHAARVDAVVPASMLTAEWGIGPDGDRFVPTIAYHDAEMLTADGIGGVRTMIPNTVFHEGVAQHLGIPVAYVKRMADVAPDLWATNVQHWLSDDPARRFLIRGFTGEDGTGGVARAMLSDRYRPLDNFDVLLTVLDGIRAGGLDVRPTSCDLTDRRMYVHFDAPSVSMVVPDVLDGYRNPYRGGGTTGDAPPVIHAGIVVSNSETGGGAFTITPRIVVQVCSNGMQRRADAFRAVHLGSQLEDGVIDWSQRTMTADLDLIRSKAVDAVSAFLNVEYLREQVDLMRQAKGMPVTDPAATIERLGKAQRWTNAETAGILDHFIRGGDVSALGVAQAVTSYVQSIDDADRADDLEGQALDAALSIR